MQKTKKKNQKNKVFFFLGFSSFLGLSSNAWKFGKGIICTRTELWVALWIFPDMEFFRQYCNILDRCFPSFLMNHYNYYNNYYNKKMYCILFICKITCHTQPMDSLFTTKFQINANNHSRLYITV
ncbi:hypothetical protein GLOIN_2v1877520 [Rhizophagus irregularis DAOM 181602=DAOM 197198]|uniref:Uncharacterized protein n=1 Tax=Rhizophagus irregularis (strain DAOM 181602 / DAOM 197198 / MUCL 43194) TaxID=747089 RepID=A0A2P4PVP8_RHIID|nr:hypothetical protein GLOIN_2v1877520 [Rhizophagus irregularis DAOM 181602=DAOM 197198]POG69440.1 hypothetical protein GLOIN_2v1877520 [Rhizophagus irregularis DAOM 181602=DAOM 197198]|eukprot:XP_025176306.1 hypothetical protein GLOIN_2v1877520 [Rhizophagus irregularis DAOM 181602=DAOM 197198]